MGFVVHFVEKVGGNYLFRGPHPLKNNNTEFDDQGLNIAIKHAYEGIPDSYYLIDISLLHADEKVELDAERKFFNDNPSAGQFVWWDTNGTDKCYFKTDPLEREYLVKTLDDWISDRPIWRVDTLHDWLDGSVPLPEPGPSDKPYVFYVHCDGGCDRTAELIGTYRLRYMGWSWNQMWQEQPCSRPLGCGNYQVVQWYAYWLNATYGFDLSGMGKEGGCWDVSVLHRLCSPILVPPHGAT
jgi:hypothetical protein